jgi:hypothetical protein
VLKGKLFTVAARTWFQNADSNNKALPTNTPVNFNAAKRAYEATKCINHISQRRHHEGTTVDNDKNIAESDNESEVFFFYL